MKFFVMSIVMLALLAALCSAQPVVSSAPAQPDTSVNIRVKRDIIPINMACRCTQGRVPLGRKCISCEMYMDLTGDYDCPVCDVHTRSYRPVYRHRQVVGKLREPETKKRNC